MGSIKVKVSNASYEGLVEQGFDLPDADNAQDLLYAKMAEKSIMKLLTQKQRRVVISLKEGLKRKEIAARLMISTQEVHQIILRIRDRLKQRMIIANTQYGRSQLWGKKSGKR